MQLIERSITTNYYVRGKRRLKINSKQIIRTQKLIKQNYSLCHTLSLYKYSNPQKQQQRYFSRRSHGTTANHTTQNTL